MRGNEDNGHSNDTHTENGKKNEIKMARNQEERRRGVEGGAEGEESKGNNKGKNKTQRRRAHTPYVRKKRRESTKQ